MSQIRKSGEIELTEEQGEQLMIHLSDLAKLNNSDWLRDLEQLVSECDQVIIKIR